MGFQLTITKGLEVGRQLAFEQAEVNLGRHSEGDVILAEAGVSRKHARVLEEVAGWFVEDLGSANGTKVNGKKISGKQRLEAGDSISLGPVSFEFQPVMATRIVAPLAAPVADQTRMIDPSTLARRAEAKKGDDESTRFGGEGPDESTDPNGGRPPSVVVDAGPEPVQATSLDVRAAPLAEAATAPKLKAVEAATNVKVRIPSELAERGGALAKGEKASAKPALSAADKARLRRQFGDSIGGQVRFLWAQLSRRTQWIAGTSLALAGIGVLGALVMLFKPEDTGKKLPPEPTEISGQTLPYSFGAGPDIDYEHEDQKTFQFRFNTPTRAVAVLHYQSAQIDTDEVAVVVNGAEQGKLPADLTDAGEHELQMVLASRDLRRNALNQLTFDNIKNPPGDGPWRIWNLAIEIVPVPELPDAELQASARDLAERGKTFLDQRAVGADNLFKSWKSYRQAWITLEAMGQKPELYRLVRHQLESVGKELDRHCNTLMLDAQRAIKLKNPVKARQTLEEVDRYFPTTEHRCHNLALAKLEEYEL